MSFDKTLHDMKHEIDAKQVVIDAVGDLSQVSLSGHQILVGYYKPPEKTAGGLLKNDSTLEESKWQGKVGLILDAGPLAFSEESKLAWHEGQEPQVGDWVLYRVYDGMQCSVNGHECRLLEYPEHVRAKLTNPDLIL